VRRQSYTPLTAAALESFLLEAIDAGELEVEGGRSSTCGVLGTRSR
jgi:hypothetical protein